MHHAENKHLKYREGVVLTTCTRVLTLQVTLERALHRKRPPNKCVIWAGSAISMKMFSFNRIRVEG